VDGRSAWPASSSSIEIQRRHVIGGTMPLRDAFFFRATNPSKELSIILIASFVALLVIGEGVGVAIALLVERFSEAASLAATAARRNDFSRSTVASSAGHPRKHTPR